MKKEKISQYAQVPLNLAKDTLSMFMQRTAQVTRNLQAEYLQNPQPSDDEEIGLERPDRFTYNPKSFKERLAVCTHIKSKLNTSKCVKIPYRSWCKYMLIILLVLFGSLFTPSLLPRWLGFEWASPKNLCQYRESKLMALQSRIDNLTDLPNLRNYQRQQEYSAKCMNDSAASFFVLPLPVWPDGCTVDQAGASLTREVCIGPFTRNSCDNIGGIKKFFSSLGGACKTVSIPKQCQNVVDNSPSRALLELERERREVQIEDITRGTQIIVDTAKNKASEIVNRLILQVDIASNIYILYSVIALVIGMPLIIFKREKGSRILGATFGMRKITFVMMVVLFLTVYDSLLVILKETDFEILFRNFRNDPCYLDPEFSRGRVRMIVDACNNVTEIGLNSSLTLQKMDETYFLARRFSMCRPNVKHMYEDDMNSTRNAYRDGDMKFPGSCNASYLDEKTSLAPENPGSSKFKALLGSGIIAQLFLKVILTSWFIHLLAFFEPMIVHNGKVEIWDTSKDGEGEEEENPLTDREIRSAVRFARDKHIVPLVTASFFLVIEIFLIWYSIVVTNTGRGDLTEGYRKADPLVTLQCPFPEI